MTGRKKECLIWNLGRFFFEIYAAVFFSSVPLQMPNICCQQKLEKDAASMFRFLMWIVKVSALGEIFLLFPPPPYKKLGPYRFSNGNSVQISEKKKPLEVRFLGDAFTQGAAEIFFVTFEV